MKNKTLEEKFQEHSLQFDNEVDRSWARYSYEAGYNLAQKESEEKIKKLREALEFYANTNNWKSGFSLKVDDTKLTETNGLRRGGKLARKVLKEIE
jgi:hypothetical protein